MASADRADRLDIHFTVGNRSELDLKFRAVVAAEKLPEETMSDFVKQSIVAGFEAKEKQQEEISAAEKVRQELMEEIRELRTIVDRGGTIRPVPVKMEEKIVKNNEKVVKLSSAWE
jgi:hypothetical protein